MTEKFVIIPQAELDKLEASRKELWALLDKYLSVSDDGNTPHIPIPTLIAFQNVTQVVWNIAARKWSVYNITPER